MNFVSPEIIISRRGDTYLGIKREGVAKILCKKCKKVYTRLFKNCYIECKKCPLWCRQCKTQFKKKHFAQTFCSNKCIKKYVNSKRWHEEKEIENCLNIKITKRWAKRSKNEIYFFKLCKKIFANTKIYSNLKLFNGYDVDVVIPLFKLTISWDGVRWHNKKKTKFNDARKKEIVKSYGYSLYTIIDPGSYNKKFVKSKFKEFIDYFINTYSDN
jgi:hypothetical protein